MTKALRVLIVEDNPGDVNLITALLARGGAVQFELESVARLSEALGRLPHDAFNLVLLDLGLPDSQGLATFERLREAAPETALVVLTGNADQDVALAAVKAGAQDYLVKGQVGGALLARSLIYAVERKQAAEELRVSEARAAERNATLSAVLESADFPIFSLDRSYCYTAWNQAHASVMKQLYGADIRLGQSLADTMAAPDWAGARENLDRALSGEVLRQAAYSGDGRRRRFFDIAHHPVRTETGEIIGVSVFAQDDTERKRAEDALHESEAWHRILFEASRDALMTLEPPSWRFTSGNPATVALFGARDEADFMSRIPSEYSPALQPDGRVSVRALEEAFEAALNEGSSFFEWRHRRVSGEEFPATVLLTRVEVDGQKLLQATVRDETEKQRLQASVAQADRLASMGMLAAGVAHEINNPLSYVLYNVESLAHDLPKLVGAAKHCFAALHDKVGSDALAEIAGDGAVMLQPAMLDDAADRAKEALSGSRRIKEIVRGLGTFSRVEQVKRSSVDLKYAIGCAVSMAHNEIRYRARLVEDYGPMPAVLASEGKLSQVFLNLLINAAHATDEGHVDANRIGIRTWSEGGNVFAEVTDTGKGIPRENLEHIFEPFFTTKPVGVGSGLGLAICRNIITDLGGDISVASEVGKGTRFVVRLPAAQEAPSDRPAAGLSSGPPASLVRGRILVVDDEEEIRKMLRRMLGRDHEIVAVAGGQEARTLLDKDCAFDIVLCDLMMPKMSGMDLHQWLVGRNPALAGRVVFLTGGAFTPKAAAYLERIANVRIEKPMDTVALRAIVKAQILEYRADRPPRAVVEEA